MKNILKRMVGTIAIPLIAFIVCQILCTAGGVTYFAGAFSWKVFVRASASVMLTTFALHINLNSGRFDFSLGAISLLSSVISAQISLSFGLPVWMMLALSIVSGFVLGVISGAVYVVLRLPAIIVSLGVTLFYEGFAYVITSGYGVSFVTNKEYTSVGTIPFYLAVIAAGLVFMIVVFDLSRFGYNHKALMYGQKIAVNTGIREIPNAILTYGIAGMLMGVVGFITATNNGTIQMSLNFGSIGVMFTAFFPMFAGGFIGRFSNDKLGYLLGAVTSAFVSLMYSRLNVDSSIQQIVTALILVGFVIFLSNEYKITSFFTGRKAEQRTA
ncbi:MAG: sugar ABC transporter permease [Lachnospiraceae bacterium]|nr:sugar ABC transporter permease [Lachnospiraceae bacterium]